ncbi:MAG TPA: polyribonucleotide nucleotidyltransferase, partial [Candidatus Aphodomonas merdavium]|nr:polyribonucleotide nucleotidyltransferase [Candidatus Aphodomonas merdavium]
MENKVYSIPYGGHELSFEFGKYAQQAGGSVLVRYGDTAVLVCATMSDKPREGIDFFPLSCDFEEKLYSVGKIPGGFIKREGRPTEKATLTARLIDRPLRPLFPKGMRNDVQVVATVLSVDTNLPPDVPAMIGASAALMVSDIPFGGPIGAAHVGLVDGEFVLTPNDEQRAVSDLNLTVAGTKDAVMMVEAGANEVSEETMLRAILYAHEEIKKVVALQETIAAEIGKEKSEVFMQTTGEDVAEAVRAFAYERSQWVFDTFDRHERQAREEQVKQETLEHFAETFEGREQEICDALYAINKEIMRSRILGEGVRPDGRSLTQIRPIWSEVGVLPRPHGSAVFTRGETQVMTIATLGAMGEVQILDGITNEETKRYMHHYNMPPYSTGEAGRMRSPGRREIGHGALAERALLPMIPSEEDFPYAIRLVSEVLSSNGSTSQASVCGSTLALMDAGVPIKAPVAGIAMGLIKDVDSGKVCVLSDIQGLEDFLGDMDFKVAGTMNGITAIQMDIKIKGIDEAILRQALKQALEGRLHILGKMLETLPQPRANLSQYAPKIIRFMINPEKIRDVIGPGGKMINKIIAD